MKTNLRKVTRCDLSLSFDLCDNVGYGMVMYKIIPELNDAEWLRKRYAEVSAYRIAKELKCVHHSVHEALRRHGIEMKPTTREQRPEELDNQSWLLRQYEKHSTREIGKMLDCSTSAVNNALHRHGIQPRERGRERASAHLQDRKWLAEQYRQYSTREIAKMLGCAQITVWKAMRNLNIATDPKSVRPLRKGKYKQKLTLDEGSRLFHRQVAEERLGRKLQLSEVVHHLDGNGLNNEPANLIVLASSSDHMILHAWLRKNGFNLKAETESNLRVVISPLFTDFP